MEQVSHFIDSQSKHIPEMLASHIEDTPDILREISEENKKGPQPPNSFPVSLDVVGLYPNIPHDEGMKAFEEKIEDPNFCPDHLYLYL